VLTYCKDENAPKNCDEREERSLLALKMWKIKNFAATENLHLTVR
jgi:hypothetical protein